MKSVVLALLLVACDGGGQLVEEGPAGPQGPRGPAGAACLSRTYVVRVSGHADATQPATVVAYCEEGDVLTGGHCDVFDDTELIQGGPVDPDGGPPIAWWCAASSVSHDPEPDNVFAAAVCLEL